MSSNHTRLIVNSVQSNVLAQNIAQSSGARNSDRKSNNFWYITFEFEITMAETVSKGKNLVLGILIFDGVDVLDFCGPFEVYSLASMLIDDSIKVMIKFVIYP